jgi:hypothetical protein
LGVSFVPPVKISGEKAKQAKRMDRKPVAMAAVLTTSDIAPVSHHVGTGGGGGEKGAAVMRSLSGGGGGGDGSAGMGDRLAMIRAAVSSTVTGV